MRNSIRLFAMVTILALVAVALLNPAPATAASKAEIDRNARAALEKLYKGNPMARALSEKATGILIFPSIYKGGLIVGAQYGDGALIKNGKIVGYYNSVAASYGLQAGGQKFGYAMFFMTDAALAYLDKSDGWEVGVGPSLVVVDKETAAAFGKTATSTTLQSDVYAFIFSQKGLMAGLGLQGSKITRIHPE
jgi:lipid-binding SYLF domain-containing protein